MPVIAALVFAAFAIAGRWVQLHPERVVPKGHFVGPDTRGARLFRAQMAVFGTFAVFGGTWFAIYSLLSLLTFGSVVLDGVAKLVGLALGLFLAVRVRREVKARPAYVSDSPYGWWP